MKLKNLSLLLALVMILSSLSVTVFAQTEEPIFEITEATVWTRPDVNNVTIDSSAVAPHFSSTYNKKVIKAASPKFGVDKTTGENYSDYNTASGDCSVRTVTKSSGGTVCNIDWSKHKYLRIEFNVFIENDTDGIGFRTKRLNGSTWSSRHFCFAVGGSSSQAPYASTRETHLYQGLSTNKWHKVVMELGAEASSTVKYYVDGENVYSEEYTNKADGIGFGGNSKNYGVVTLQGKRPNPLGIYLSDFKMYASNTGYSSEGEIVPQIPSVSEDAVAFVEDGKVYGAKTLTNGALIGTNDTDDINIDAENNFVFTYNDTSKRVKYYDFINDGCYVRNHSVTINESANRVVTKATLYNFKDVKDQVAVVTALYKKGADNIPTLVNTRIATIPAEAGKMKSETLYRGTEEIDFDYVKAFFWEGVKEDRIPFCEPLYVER